MSFQPILEKEVERPLVIAGPCSAETEDQVMEIARELAKQKVDLYRAGIWKPRTRPNSFEGVGRVGLKWLKRVREETGLKVTTEVANTAHVYEALKHEIDVLWVGARSTVNPFVVQEIADALEGVDKPVMIKNPINPDLSLWIGAIERMYKAGITRIAAIHRGFSSYGDSKFRNVPRWQIPIELKRLFPDLMIICDNSHICGRRDTLAEVAQQAMDLNFDGIMTETHCQPNEAWSDARQQITPATFEQLVNNLVLRSENTNDAAFLENLVNIRKQIDELDEELLNILGARMKLSERIGAYKKKNNISILQTARWNEILQHSINEGQKRGLTEEFITKYLHAVHQESIGHQVSVMNQQEVPSNEPIKNEKS